MKGMLKSNSKPVDVEAISAGLIWKAEKKLKITASLNGNSCTQIVHANSYRTGLFLARATIATRNYDVAMEGSYSVEVL